LTDFDLVHASDTTGGTRTGFMGTFGYAAPEAMTDASRADVRADIFSLGKVGVFMLHGSELPAEAIRDAEGFIEALPCDDAIKGILQRACAWDVTARYPTVNAMLADLDSLGGERKSRSSIPDARRKDPLRWALRFMLGPHKDRELRLPETGHVVVGSGDGVDFQLQDPSMAPMHARFLCQRGKVVLLDLHSPQGTFVNAKRVARTELRDGDRIIMGESMMKIVARSERAKDSPPGTEELGETGNFGPRRELSGDLSAFPLPALVQQLASAKRSCVLVVRSGDDSGRLYFDAGVIAFALLNDLDAASAAKAVSRILTWQTGEFHVEQRGKLTIEGSLRLQVNLALANATKILREVLKVTGAPDVATRIRVHPAGALSLKANFQLVLDTARERWDLEGVLNACRLDDLTIAQTLAELARLRLLTIG
jgi:hypothetical protein